MRRSYVEQKLLTINRIFISRNIVSYYLNVSKLNNTIATEIINSLYFLGIRPIIEYSTSLLAIPVPLISIHINP